MTEEAMKRVLNLLTIKSIVTLALTATFCVLVSRGEVPQDYMTVYTAVIGFYFGTQSRKGEYASQ